MSGKYREFPPTPYTHSHTVRSSIVSVLYQTAAFVTVGKPALMHHFYPKLFGFAFGVFHSVGFDTCLITCTHYYVIIQNSFAAQKVLLYSRLKLQSFSSYVRQKELQDSVTFLVLKLASTPVPQLLPLRVVLLPFGSPASLSLCSQGSPSSEDVPISYRLCMSPPSPPTATGFDGALVTFPT